MKIVADSSGDIPKSWIEKYDIHILPVNITFGTTSYRQGIDIHHADFYRMVKEQRIIPKTSLPSPAQIEDFYSRISHLGDTILSIHVSSKLSGTVMQVQEAAKSLVGRYKVIPFDTLSGSAMMAFFCREARLMEQSGCTPEEILKRLEQIRNRINIVFTVDNLEFARLSGRINALQNILASVLQIKPIIILKDGLLEISERVRSRSKSFDRILGIIKSRVGTRPVNLAVVHANDEEAGRTLYERTRELLNCQESFLADLSISVAAHLGPGAIGIVAYTVEE